jgi:hypothetical protein
MSVSRVCNQQTMVSDLCNVIGIVVYESYAWVFYLLV